jgi:orotidine-5'-phosphate decarboxylase
VLVVPGIRPASLRSTSTDDQVRVATPAAAIRRGADRIVVGRPITEAEDPAQAAEAIADEIRRFARI